MNNINKLVLKVLIFIIPVIVVLVVTEALYRNIPNDYSYKSSYVKENGDKIEILVLGSSHAYRGVNPKKFDKACFNFAMVSQTLEYDKAVLKSYIKYLPDLEYVVLPVSYFTLRRDLENSVEYWRKYHYSIYTDLEMIDKSEKRSLKHHIALTTTNGKNISKKMAGYYLKGNDNRICDENGWAMWPVDLEKDLKETAITAAKRHEDNSLDLSSQLNTLIEIIEMCQNSKCKVILFTPPGTSYYVDELNSEKWKLIGDTCDSLSQVYQNTVYKNFINDKGFNNSCFGDADHLNQEGANILSDQLNLLTLEH